MTFSKIFVHSLQISLTSKAPSSTFVNPRRPPFLLKSPSQSRNLACLQSSHSPRTLSHTHTHTPRFRMSEPEGGEEEDRDKSASERPESESGSLPLQPLPSPSWRRESGGEREKDDSQTRWRERTKTRREREGGCSAVHCRRSWGQLKPPPLLGLAVLLSSLSASTITSCVSSMPFSTPRENEI
ncbi:uncharacterized protein LOC110271412 isoform X2 [Arachis ipaensis]|uniref:uncharacterized protein LOC110271412 isoform X2 n=1 Tax=Arachis ipaensis TaxID=130454 RepID=UPI000A2AFBE9|nr:uncharacterized protein LOC110271412 isoform X2 [Arachis ipaensis]